MRTLYIHDDSKIREEFDIINVNHMVQNLYDHLICAGLRQNIWPTETKSRDDLDIDDAFRIISDFMDVWKRKASEE